MADSEVRIQPICFKLNSSHLQFKVVKKVGKVLNKPSTHTHIYIYSIYIYSIYVIMALRVTVMGGIVEETACT